MRKYTLPEHKKAEKITGKVCKRLSFGMARKKIEASIKNWTKKLCHLGFSTTRNSSGFSQPEGIFWVIFVAFVYAIALNLARRYGLLH